MGDVYTFNLNLTGTITKGTGTDTTPDVPPVVTPTYYDGPIKTINNGSALNSNGDVHTPFAFDALGMAGAFDIDEASMKKNPGEVFGRIDFVKLTKATRVKLYLGKMKQSFNLYSTMIIDGVQKDISNFGPLTTLTHAWFNIGKIARARYKEGGYSGSPFIEDRSEIPEGSDWDHIWLQAIDKTGVSGVYYFKRQDDGGDWVRPVTNPWAADPTGLNKS